MQFIKRWVFRKQNPCKEMDDEVIIQPCNGHTPPFSLPQVNGNIRLTGSWERGPPVVLSRLWDTMEKIREHN